MTKITNKTIEEETDLMVEVIADTVAERAVGHAMANELGHWENLSKTDREKLDQKFIAEKNRVAAYLADRAETTFQHSLQFNKGVNGKGNKGRDHLYTFMYHWTGFHSENGIDYTCKEAGLYKKALINYERSKRLHSENKLNNETKGISIQQSEQTCPKCESNNIEERSGYQVCFKCGHHF